MGAAVVQQRTNDLLTMILAATPGTHAAGSHKVNDTNQVAAHELVWETLRSPLGQGVLLAMAVTMTACFWIQIWRARDMRKGSKWLWSAIVMVPLAGWVLYLGQRWLVAKEEEDIRAR